MLIKKFHGQGKKKYRSRHLFGLSKLYYYWQLQSDNFENRNKWYAKNKKKPPKYTRGCKIMQRLGKHGKFGGNSLSARAWRRPHVGWGSAEAGGSACILSVGGWRRVFPLLAFGQGGGIPSQRQGWSTPPSNRHIPKGFPPRGWGSRCAPPSCWSGCGRSCGTPPPGTRPSSPSAWPKWRSTASPRAPLAGALVGFGKKKFCIIPFSVTRRRINVGLVVVSQQGGGDGCCKLRVLTTHVRILRFSKFI